ncbi:MAG: TrbC/VirB2 family protein [Paracoccaceae bacterium]|nr:TrbC/VirB2 family protein [Paracoccaceae bacterium]MDE3120568.1 TrbC/VirB2 family protein [Paracoccaceae bacterium]MDE3238898.1 TrbC/VirB2 family protein [Paracoccaceae bacterium]
MANSKRNWLPDGLYWPARVVSAWAVAVLPAAASTAGTGMPWDSPIQTLVNSIKGPVAFGFAFLGIVALGVRWIFGGELGPAAKMLMTVVIGVALLSGATGVLASLFSLTGATVQ